MSAPSTPPQDQPDPGCAGDHRPNSGLREGDVSHAEVNAAIRAAAKTIIFGQQTRLRDGVVTADDLLPRFHAGHDLVKFFYGGVRQLPDYLRDALLDRGISVTMVSGGDLLVFHDARRHQSGHTGRTRRTIYLPEKVLDAAFAKGYDYWAIGEVLIYESWPLLDYLAIVELARRCQQRLRERTTLGHSYVKDTLRRFSAHRKEQSESEENELAEFWRRYADGLFGWDRSILDRDPYELAAEVYDEERERVWAELKIDAITQAFRYPTYYNLDRDVVHPTVFDMATARGLPLEPQTVADLLHDLADAARFKVSRQIKTDALLDRLLEHGAAGIKGLADAAAAEKASGHRCIIQDQHDGYETLAEFKKRLQRHSSSWPEGAPGSISNDFNDLLANRLLLQIRAEFHALQTLPRADLVEGRDRLRAMLYQVMPILRPDLDPRDTIETPAEWRPSRQTDKWMELLAFLLRQEPADREVELLSEIVRKLDGHPLYHVFQVALDGAQPGERQSLEDRAIKRFYALVGAEPDRGQWDRDRQVYCELRAEYSDDAILRAAEWTAANIRGAQTFVLVRATIAEALAQP